MLILIKTKINWQVLSVPSTVKSTKCVHKEFVSDKPVYQNRLENHVIITFFLGKFNEPCTCIYCKLL